MEIVETVIAGKQAWDASQDIIAEVSDYMTKPTRKRQNAFSSKKGSSKKAKTDPIKKTGTKTNYGPKLDLKGYDNVLSLTNQVAATLSYACVNDMTQGPNLYQRIGRKVFMKSLQIRGQWAPNIALTGSVSPQSHARLLILYDKAADAAFPNAVDVLRDANAGGSAGVYSAINLDNRERFVVLRDWDFILPSCTNNFGVLTNVGITDTCKQSLQIDAYMKLDGIETLYNNVNGGTVADITTGSLLVIGLGENAAWLFSGYTRLRYTD